MDPVIPSRIRLDFAPGIGSGPVLAVALDLCERAGLDLDQCEIVGSTLTELIDEISGEGSGTRTVSVTLTEDAITFDACGESPRVISDDLVRMADAAFARFDPSPADRPGGFVAVAEPGS